jgi:hypothetical protein
MDPKSAWKSSNRDWRTTTPPAERDTATAELNVNKTPRHPKEFQRILNISTSFSRTV